MLQLGIIADTHIPDRVKAIPQTALDVFQNRAVDHILHAGDISRQRILDQLAEIAPVTAVRGNLDIFGFDDLPMHRELQFEGVTIGMTHGHMNWPIYFVRRIMAEIIGPSDFSETENRALANFPNANVVIFGHNHVPVNRQVGHQLLFNPGSPTIVNPTQPHLKPSVGLLHIDNAKVTGEIVFLE